jgi:hypothetical protein
MLDPIDGPHTFKQFAFPRIYIRNADYGCFSNENTVVEDFKLKIVESSIVMEFSALIEVLLATINRIEIQSPDKTLRNALVVNEIMASTVVPDSVADLERNIDVTKPARSNQRSRNMECVDETKTDRRTNHLIYS